jgi:ubiquitin-protein ligase
MKNSTSPEGDVENISLTAKKSSLKDINIATEYKYLIADAPCGVYVLPQLDDIRKFHGVIFIRSGLYKDGVFRFRIDLPPGYNDINMHPLVTFTPPVFNPLIDMATGKLELTADPMMREWNPQNHFLATCIGFLKKAFVTRSYDDFDQVPNEQARDM